jgi:hypothetical protein
MLATAPGLLYVHEPFSVSDPPGRGVCNVPFERWFTYVTAENEAPYYRAFKDTVALEYNRLAALRRARSPAAVARALAESREWATCRRRGDRPLIKDPIALFSSEWLAQRFDMHVVVVIRHPAAFVSSITRLGWRHPFAHFLEQPGLMRDLLQPFAQEIRDAARHPPDLVDEASLLWRVIHHAIARFRERHPDWIFVRHEDLSRDPLAGFRRLFEALGLAWSPAVERVVERYSGDANPRDTTAPVGSEQTLRRASAQNVSNWKRRLNAAEIARIRANVADVAGAFYSEAEW